MQYVPASELAGLPGFPRSAKAAREAAARLELPYRPRHARGGGREYAVDALPPDAQAALARRRSIGLDPVPAARALEATLARAAGTASVAHVTGWRKEHQSTIVAVLVLFSRFWQVHRGPLTPALKAFVHAWNGGLSSIRIQADDRVVRAYPTLAVSTLRRWHIGVQERGLAAITPPEHHRKGRFGALSGEVGEVVLNLLTDRPRLSASAIYAAVAAQFADLRTERAFRRALGQWRKGNAHRINAIALEVQP